MAKYNKPVFVNESLADKKIKTASKFIAYKTWDDPSLWFAEVVDNGNAFFHWHQGKRNEGHKDSIINYISADSAKWQATIKDYVYFHAPNGDKSKGHEDTVIAYISGDNQAYVGSFAEWFDEGEPEEADPEFLGLRAGGWKPLPSPMRRPLPRSRNSPNPIRG